MPATIAIVGRPNVGKSTVFNRLTGRRSGLVSEAPGLTRGRREGTVEIGGRTASVIDTAGLEEAAAGSIAARMRQQTETAIASADVVLFVVDSRDGITSTDIAFARLVRSSGRPVVLVANKCEGRKGADGFYEAFELGLGEPIAISAEHGEGIADLLSDIQAALGWRTEPDADGEDSADGGIEPPEHPTKRPIRVAVVGRPNSGKSTLVNALLGEERMITGPEPGLTRDSIATDFTWGLHKFRLFDTAGLGRKGKIKEKGGKIGARDAGRALRFAEIVGLLIDSEGPLE